MSDIDIDAIVAAAVEKTATAMAMKEAERKSEEKTRLEAEQKAAAEAEAQKSAQEAQIATAVSSGAERLMADVEAKMNAKDADHAEIIGSLQNELKEKAAEIEQIQNSKRVFSDRSEKSSYNEEDLVNAHILGVVTNKGLEGTRFGRSILEKATNNNASVRLPASASDDFESTVSTAIERDIELELILDPLFRKIQMNAASMVIPTMPDSGYAEWLSSNAAGTGAGAAAKGNLGSRDEASPGANAGVTLGSKVLTVEKLVSKSFMANETEEDAIMPILPLIREAMVRAHARAIEHSILQAGSSEVVNAGGQNGLIKLATDDSKVLDAGASAGAGAVTATTAQLLNMRQAMGKYGRRPGDVVYIISMDAYYDMLDDPEFQDVNLVGSDRASKISGEIGQAYGSPIIVCDEFTGGKTANKVWGVAVNTRNFLVPVLRGVTVESDYDVENQRRVLVATQRRGFDQMFSAAGQVVAHKW